MYVTKNVFVKAFKCECFYKTGFAYTDRPLGEIGALFRHANHIAQFSLFTAAKSFIMNSTHQTSFAIQFSGIVPEVRLFVF